MNDYETLVGALLRELDGSLRSVNADDVAALRQAVLSARRVFVAGKGRSGLQMRAFAMRLMHMERAVFVVDEVTTPGIAEGDLLLVGSGSGRTPSIVYYAEKAKSQGAKVALITIDAGSPVAQHADFVVRIAAHSPKLGGAEGSPVTVMASLFEQSLGLLLDILIAQMMEALGVDAAAMFSRHANLE